MTKNRFLAFLFGAVMTALVQSAFATTVLTVGLVNSGMIEFSKAIGLIIGANLGTCVTSLISSLGTSNNGKRTALLNLYYQSIGPMFG